ncbi:MAG: Hpt domain-containing protein [Bacteriovoracaceae bacterium]|nr:Hpt domain-containing protein [Bacteriovoracaceae bacterium]
MDSDDLEFLETLRSEFYSEAAETLNECEDILLYLRESPENDQLLVDYKTTLHTLKGSSHAVEYFKLAQVITLIEETVIELKEDLEKLIGVNLSLISIIHRHLGFLKSGDDKKADIILEKILSTKR